MHVDIQYLVNINPISSPPLTARDAPQRPATMAEDEVEKVRLEGNAAFKAGNFAEALEKYSAAIALAPENHLLYSNRSLAHHSAGDFEAAKKDAEKALELSPEFIKGFHRLANALLGLKQYDDAELAIKSGLAKDGDNPELKKLMRVVKGKRDKDRRAALAPAGGRAPPDEAARAEAQALSESLQKNGREPQETQARLGAVKREIQRTQITCNEIGALPADAEVYRSVGKMFVMSDKPGVEALLDGQLKRGEERASQLAARGQFLDRRVKEQQSEFQQLLKTAA